MRKQTSALVCVVLGTTLSTAHADEMEAGAPPAATASGIEQVTLPKGRVLLDVALEANLSTDQVFKPFSISPDLWYGVTDELSVGVVHSSLGSTGFVSNFTLFGGDALCVSGSDNGCLHPYNNVGIDARYKLKLGDLAFAAEYGLFARSLNDPFALAAKLGVVGRWTSDKLSIEAQPN